jgi:hypothetical protein
MKLPRIKLPERDRTPKNKTPWLITRIENGLKAVNVKDSRILGFSPVKELPTRYFEFDRIYGQGAFAGCGPLRVIELFDELREVTPRTVGYICGQYNYILRPDGIRRQNRKNMAESFFSDETLRTTSTTSFLQIENEADSGESTVHGEGSEFQDDDGSGGFPTECSDDDGDRERTSTAESDRSVD